MKKLSSKKEFTPAQELFIGIIALILFLLFGNFLLEIPIIGFLVAAVGWLVPLAFIWGGWERLSKQKASRDTSDWTY